MNGVLIVDKEKGMTSFDVIRQIKREKKDNKIKIGHIGTLDPMATGVLPILLGEATKLSDYLMEHDKDYVAILKLGEKRSTGDQEGDIVETADIPEFDENKIKEVLNSFIGKSEQIPPMYSALKVNGKKLYELARQGIEVERKPRIIEITKIELISINGNEVKFKVTCSKGTYIRTLCEDIAKKLGTVGYMADLRRTRVGNFKVENAGTFIELEDVLQGIRRIEVLNEKKLINGVSLNEKEYKIIKDSENNTNLCNLYIKGKYIGIGEMNQNNLKRKIII